jgi:hypothetical protein
MEGMASLFLRNISDESINIEYNIIVKNFVEMTCHLCS